MTHLPAWEQSSPSGVAGMGGLRLGCPRQHDAKARWNSRVWVSLQMGQIFPLRGQTRASERCPKRQHRLHCGTPERRSAGETTRRCLPYMKLRPTRLRRLRPARESAISNQTVQVSERAPFGRTGRPRTVGYRGRSGGIARSTPRTRFCLGLVASRGGGSRRFIFCCLESLRDSGEGRYPRSRDKSGQR